MKKSWLLIVIVSYIIFIGNLVHAQTNDISNETSKLFDDLSKEVFNSPTSAEIELPKALQTFSRVLFGFTHDSEKVKLVDFVILSVLFILLLVFIFEAAKFLFRRRWQQFLGALIITALIGIGGGIHQVMIFLLNFSAIIGIVEGFPTLKLMLTVIILALFVFLLVKFLGIIREQVLETTEEAEGKKAGVMVSLLSRFSRVFSSKKEKE